ncbi:DUF389 domain-containing protein [Rhodobacterales bacterium]|nr:DUF389 domain-containing protein [Rhodobacterales bacterium]
MASAPLSTAKEILRFEGVNKIAYWRKFALLLGLAVTIATMGLLRNSGAVVIAAMLIAPLMTPILGITSSLVMGWVGRASMLIVIVWLAAGTSVMLAWLIVWIADVPSAILLPEEVLSRSNPGAEDLVVALAAGIAGAYVQVKKTEISLLPGAAIGVSLVPPLAAAGILFYFAEYARAFEASFLFATNFGAIILSAALVYVALSPAGTLFKKTERRLKFTLGMGVTLAFLFFVVVHLFAATYYRYLETRMESTLAYRIKEWAADVPVEILRVDVHAVRKVAEVWVLVDLPSDSQYKVASLSDLLPSHLKQKPFRHLALDVLGKDYEIIVRYQTRIAWLLHLDTQTIDVAPATGIPQD